MPSRRPLSTVVGGVLLVVSLLVCGIGGGVLLGPVSRSGADIDLASSIGGKGYSIFDMNEGDDYWIYQPAEQSWSDSITCDVADSGDAGDSWVVRHGARPATAPERISHFDARTGEDNGTYDFSYYGTLRGDRTKAFLSVECTPTDFLVVPSRAPQWYLAGVGSTGGLIGVAGIVVLLVGLIRVRRRPGVPAAASPSVPALAPLAPTTPSSVPSAPAAPFDPPLTPPEPVPAGGPRRRTYLFAVPPVILAVLLCCAGGLTGLSLGFTDTFGPPDIGTENQGVVGRVLNNSTDYALYADETGVIPSRDKCSVRERDVPHLAYWRNGRPIGDPETVSYNSHTYRYVGTLHVDDIIIGIVDCSDESSLLLRPSHRSWPVVWGAVGVASLSLAAAAAAGLTIAIRRRRAAVPVP